MQVRSRTAMQDWLAMFGRLAFLFAGLGFVFWLASGVLKAL